MFKSFLFTAIGFLLIGCTGSVLLPDSTLFTDEVQSDDASPVQQDSAATPEQGAPTTAPDEMAAAYDVPAPTESALPGVALFDFVPGESRWFSVDDSVMGGVSNSTIAIARPGYLSFSGTMSLENNGGFASTRSEWQAIDLSESDGILLSVLGDGNTYRLRMQTATTRRDVSYNALFDTTPNQPQLVYIPFEEMVPTYFGYVVDVGPIDRANIGSFGFMLSDNQPGEFELYVDWVRAVTEEELLALSR